jgi:hypothetical protein
MKLHKKTRYTSSSLSLLCEIFKTYPLDLIG